ncbi:hypothetical protein F5Y17DRAFT_338937 [Xylariaceae sp. FL0594]|nr:hypothetical protein F5Y17DRAFT_338937 [Xylariaceae sp. FL0594]
MAQATVGDVVTALLDSYTTALECYGSWHQRQWLNNRCRTRGESYNHKKPGFCAASSSLTISRLQIEEAYNNGVDMLGHEFVLGDAACYDVVHENLERLRECVGFLEAAVKIENHPLPLGEVTRVSEAVRIACLAALQKQYQRLVVGRLVPRELSQSTKKPERPQVVCANDGEEASRETGSVGLERGGQPSNSEALALRQVTPSPPSPPLTPTRPFKSPPNDAPYPPSARPTPRPTKSVLSVFCPQAMQYQFDLEKAMPKGTKCKCGYDWDAGFVQETRAMVIKDGFRMTPRFLGKSHMERGFGCVLCTSRGKIETFGHVERLKAHINSSHTRWQLLHDRDLSGH